MNDTYVEVLVSRKKSPFLDAGRMLSYAVAVICLFLAAVSPYRLPFLVAAAAFGAFAYFYLPRLDIEYEYLYIDKEISIDKIMSKEKRAKVMTLDLNKMEIMAPVRSHELDSYRARGLKEYDFTSATQEGTVYTIVYSKEQEGTVLVNIEPNEAMLRAIKNVFPRKICW